MLVERKTGDVVPRLSPCAGHIRQAPVGLLSTTDLLRATSMATTDKEASDAILDHTYTIVSLMQEAVVLRANQTVREAVGVYAEGHIHSLPVVDDHENLVGIVTTTDVLRYMQEQY
jgi:CBS-domain-containing membrane protein